ncbi:MAG: hypothetical protein V1776_00865 [Candidatus Diapherotrites archaeon]
MSTWIVDIEKEVEEKFRKIVEKRYGPGEQTTELVLNRILKKWVERNV